MATPRYAIEFSVKEVDESGDTFGPEMVGATTEYTSTDIEWLHDLVCELADHAHDSMTLNRDFQHRRPPEEDKEIYDYT